MDTTDDQPSSHHTGLDSALEGILKDVGKQLAMQHDQQMIDKVMVSIAEQFRGARITAYLPILIKRKAFEHLKLLSI